MVEKKMSVVQELFEEIVSSLNSEQASNEIFISYSRRDKAFVQELDAAFRRNGHDPWVDWNDIKPTEDWWEAIQAGIEAASTFVFVLSPDSVNSQVCGQEVEHAIANNKRLVPVVYREGFDLERVNPTIRRHNFIFLRESDPFDRSFQTLLSAIRTDLDYARSHTRLLTRAIEWKKKDQNESFLLQGKDLEEAEQWLAKGTKQEPYPTDLQRDYIATSRKVEIRRQRSQLRLQRIALIFVTVGLLAASISSAIAWQAHKKAERQRINTDIISQSWAAKSLLSSGLDLEAMRRALQMGKEVKQLGTQLDIGTRMRALASLQEVVYNLHLRNSLYSSTSLVGAVAFSPDGKLVAAASADKAVRVWTVEGQLVQVLKGHQSPLNGVSFSPDGSLLASASEDRTIKIWDPASGKELRTLRGHTDVVQSVNFSPDGKQLVSASDDGTIRIWSVSGQELEVLRGHQGIVFSANFSPDGQTIASTGEDNIIRLWDLTPPPPTTRSAKATPASKESKQIKGTRTPTSPRNNQLQTGAKPVLPTRREKARLLGHTNAVYEVRFSPDGQSLASASKDGTIKLWSVDGRLLKSLEGHEGPVRNVAFSPDSKLIASAGEDTTVRLWSTSGLMKQVFRGHTNFVNGVSFSPDGSTLASGGDTSVKLWRVEKFASNVQLQHNSEIYSIDYSPDGQTIATASRDNTVKLWGRNGNLLQTLEGHKDKVYSVRFSPDGQTLVTSSADSTIKLWNLEGKQLQTLGGHEGAVYSVSFSPDGKLLVSGGEDKTVRLWTTTGQLLTTITGHHDVVYSVNFSPDGKLIASASGYGLVRLWTPDGQFIRVFDGHQSAINSITFSPDSKLLATAGDDGLVKLWTIEGQLKQTIEAHNLGAWSVAFSPDGEMLLSGGQDLTVKLWDFDGQNLLTLRGHKSGIWRAVFSPDGKTIASASADGTAILWNMDLDDLVSKGCDGIREYLLTSPKLTDSDRRLCENILPSAQSPPQR